MAQLSSKSIAPRFQGAVDQSDNSADRIASVRSLAAFIPACPQTPGAKPRPQEHGEKITTLRTCLIETASCTPRQCHE